MYGTEAASVQVEDEATSCCGPEFVLSCLSSEERVGYLAKTRGEE